MRLACLVNQYPKTSHSFIRREIAALEGLGAEVDRLSLRRTDADDLADPADRAEAARTHAVLSAGAPRLLADALAEAVRAPRRFAAAAALALRLGAASERGRAVHLIYLAEAAHLARRLRARGTAHLHAHFGTNSATVAMLAAELAGIPFSVTVHGPEEFDAPRALGLGEKIARAAFVAGVSAYGRGQLMRWSRAEDHPRLAVVRCGLDPARFAAGAAATPPPEAPHFVAVGRLSAQKAPLILLEAVAEARRAVPGLTLTLVGDGELRGAVERRRAELGLEDAVEITGWADEAEVRRRLLGARALVMASLAEGLPVVIMEAFALGRPAIVPWIAGIPELVDESCGWRAPSGDPAALAAALVAAAGTPTARLAEMGAEGRRRVLARHDQAREAARLLALIRGAAGAADRPAGPGTTAAPTVPPARPTPVGDAGPAAPAHAAPPAAAAHAPTPADAPEPAPAAGRPAAEG